MWRAITPATSRISYTNQRLILRNWDSATAQLGQRNRAAPHL